MRLVKPRLVIGLVLVGVFLILGIIVPLFAPEDPTAWHTYPRNKPPSFLHLMGTNNLGQDIFWLLTWSIRNSLWIGLSVAALATIIGVLIGMLAGFVGGGLDRILTLCMDVVIAVPSLPILIMISALLGGNASLVVIAMVLVFFNWPWPGRQARAMSLSLREREFINVARASGESTVKILVLEILPFMLGWALANFINTILVAIAAESGLAIIGLSSLKEATLGTMIYWAMQHQALLLEQWLWILSPILSIMLLFIGLFLVSTGWSDYFATRRGRQ
ncbi:ABC transporter permease [Caldilinea sp.]|uniref:ABC transporter permease n=1 Tax=Caldilinea sp. TaxID=2293560 RepID=UPI0021DC41F5|nr:ABC transporter permease [Caldilinea sp.]GIV70391.1 MAG: peptide ABC transporter [Caldilinea sp.]